MLALVLLLTTALPAMASHDPVTLYGRIADDADASGIAFADVQLIDGLGYVLASSRTDASGEFRFLVRRPGAYYLRAQHVGYRENTTPALWLGEHSVVRVELRLSMDAVLLAPLEIVARSRPQESAVLSNFRARLTGAPGTFITRADIDERHPGLISDLLATLPGLYLESTTGTASGRVVYMSRSTRGCPAEVYLDGVRVSRGSAPVAVDDLVSPSAVEGIEVYRGLSTIPAELLSDAALRCGVVAIWTRRSER